MLYPAELLVQCQFSLWVSHSGKCLYKTHLHTDKSFFANGGEGGIRTRGTAFGSTLA